MVCCVFVRAVREELFFIGVVVESCNSYMNSRFFEKALLDIYAKNETVVSLEKKQISSIFW